MESASLTNTLIHELVARYPETTSSSSTSEEIDDSIHALPDHLKISIVEECETHYALWFYSTMFGVDTLSALEAQLTGKLWHQQAYPQIPRRAVIPCQTVDYQCMAIVPGLILLAGETTIGVLLSEQGGYAKGQRQGVFRRYNVFADENSTKANIVGIGAVSPEFVYQGEEYAKTRGGAIIVCLMWDDGHGSSYWFSVERGFVLREVIRKRDYGDTPMPGHAVIVTERGRVAFLGASTIVTYPSYRPLIPKERGGGNHLLISAYATSACRKTASFTCGAGIAAYHMPFSNQVTIMYVPILNRGQCLFPDGGFASQRDPTDDEVVNAGSLLTLAFPWDLIGTVTSLHVTRSGFLCIGFDTGWLSVYRIPLDPRELVGYFMSKQDFPCVCSMNTGFGGALEAIYSNAFRVAVVLSSGFLQVYDICTASGIDMTDPVSVVPVRTIDLTGASDKFEEEEEEEDDDNDKKMTAIESPPKRIKVVVSASTVPTRYSTSAGRKIVCLDSRRLVYFDASTRLLSVWSFGPCI